MHREVKNKDYSAMVSISPDLFFVKKRFRDEKLRRFESRLADASERLLMLVGGRVEVGESVERSVCAEEGDMASSLPDMEPDMEPFGVLKFLLGNKPNCALCRDDMDEPDRGDASEGDMADAPEMEEYAESLPVSGGLSGLAEYRFGAFVSFSSVLPFEWSLRWPKSRLARPVSFCDVVRPRWSSLCHASW